MQFALESTLPDFESIPFGDPTITGLVLEGGLDMSRVFDVNRSTQLQAEE